jgi:D-3-phosphoglycerate dehydrogenase
MAKIQTLNKISSTGLELLPREDYEIASEFSNPDAIILRSFKMHDMELPESLLAVARAGAGTNNIPIDKCSEKGIVVFNTPGANANSVKELVISSLFLSSRKIADSIEWCKGLEGNGDEVPKMVEKGKSMFAGPEIAGKKLGIIGLGAIGVMVANAATALGMEVTGYDPFISVESAWGLSRDVKKGISMDSVIAESDYISIHVPLNDNTKGLFNKDKFKIMKNDVRLLNFARGGLVNNEDLKKAIADGVIACYVTDFPDEDLIKMDNVLAIPHLGASTAEAEENCAKMAAEQLKNFLETGNIKNSVNYPDCSMEINGNNRIIITNKNIPNIIGQVTSMLAADDINIAEYLNKHRNDYAYNIIDVETDIPENITDKLMQIDGIISVRIINKK